MKLFCALLLLFMVVPAHADTIRDRIKDHLKDKIVDKLESQLPPIANKEVNDPITKPGDYIYAIEFEGLVRMYHLHVPWGYTPARPVALLVALHGGGGDMEYMANDKYYKLISKADHEGFAVVFPNGYSKFQSGKLATWNAGGCCGDARDLKIDDVGFIKQMLTNITSHMPVDKTRIYATGMSNGGLMAYTLACQMPDTFRAIASVAGTDNNFECNPVRPISILHIHAINDDHVLFNGGAGQGSFKDVSKVTNFTSVPDTIMKWLNRDRCNPQPVRVLNTPDVYCDQFSQCAGGAKIKLCVTANGKHSWPGGYKPRGDEQPSKAIDADDMMWDFFESVR